MNLAYNFTDKIIGRLAASTTMTRPNPSSMLPGLGFGDPSAQNGSLGNPGLKPYISKNLDLGFEYYTGQEGYVALTAFNKKVTGFTNTANFTYPFSYLAQYGITYNSANPTQQVALQTRCGCVGHPDMNVINNLPVNLSQPINASGLLKINGLEASWVQPLGQWWSALDGFGYSANYTYIKQKG